MEILAISLDHIRETNMHGSYTYKMYDKYTLFYESPKNLGYYTHAQTVYQALSSGGRGLGTRLELTTRTAGTVSSCSSGQAI